jgi:hypothetical protein
MSKLAGRKPIISFKELVQLMVDADLKYLIQLAPKRITGGFGLNTILDF